MLRLDTLLGRIFNKIQRLTPKGAHRLLTTFIGSYDDVVLGQPTAMEVKSPPMPGYWADSEGAWNATDNLLWDEGQWDE